MQPTRPVLLYAGVVACAIGFVLIAFSWGRIAALDSVAQQVPYLASGGLTGLGSIILGATAINIYVKQREGAERARQAIQLIEVMRQVTAALGGEPVEVPVTQNDQVAPVGDRTPGVGLETRDLGPEVESSGASPGKQKARKLPWRR